MSFCLSSCFISETTESTATLFGILQDEGGDESSPEFMGRMLINISYESCTSQWDLHLRFVLFLLQKEPLPRPLIMKLSSHSHVNYVRTRTNITHTRRINESLIINCFKRGSVYKKYKA